MTSPYSLGSGGCRNYYGQRHNASGKARSLMRLRETAGSNRQRHDTCPASTSKRPHLMLYELMYLESTIFYC